MTKPNTMRTVIALLTMLLLAACSSTEENPYNDIQGDWQLSCQEGEPTSSMVRISIEDNQLTRATDTFYGGDGCRGDDYVTENVVATITITGQVTNTDIGDPDIAEDQPAKHIDIKYERAFLTASESHNNRLASEGTSLADVAAARGIANIDDIPVGQLLDQTELYTIYFATCRQIKIGLSQVGGNDGSEPALRHTELDLELDNVFFESGGLNPFPTCGLL